MNVFGSGEVAAQYDAYYATEFGRKIDEIEKEVMMKLMQHIPVADMLELGCGTGHWTCFFVDQGFRLTATDISEPMLSIAKEKGIPADFRWANSMALPYNDASFSAVASITMLEFVDDQRKVFEEVFRILKPGGWLLLGCLNADSALALNKDQDDTFRQAKFLTRDQLTEQLETFGSPVLDYGAYLTTDYRIVDGTLEEENTQPVFMAARVQKTKLI